MTWVGIKIDKSLLTNRFITAKYLHDFVKANIDRSTYAFCLDRKDPGSFVLGFMASAKSALNRWSVQVTPGMYVLNGAQLPTVADLCRAFKLQYADILKNPRSRLANGGKTPFAGGRTPATGARTPARGAWGTTPAQGKASAWGGGNRTPAAGWGGGRTPHHGGRTPAINHGGRTPAQAVQAANANWNNNNSWEAPGSEGWNNSAPTQDDSWNTSGDASTARWDNSRGWNS